MSIAHTGAKIREFFIGEEYFATAAVPEFRLNLIVRGKNFSTYELVSRVQMPGGEKVIGINRLLGPLYRPQRALSPVSILNQPSNCRILRRQGVKIRYSHLQYSLDQKRIIDGSPRT